MIKAFCSMTIKILAAMSVGMLLASHAHAQSELGDEIEIKLIRDRVEVSTLEPVYLREEFISRGGLGLEPEDLKLNFDEDYNRLLARARSQMPDESFAKVIDLVDELTKEIPTISQEANLNRLFCTPIVDDYTDRRSEGGKYIIGNFMISIAVCTPKRDSIEDSQDYIGYTGVGQAGLGGRLRGDLTKHFYELFQLSNKDLNRVFESWYRFRAFDFLFHQWRLSRTLTTVSLPVETGINFFEERFNLLSDGKVTLVEKSISYTGDESPLYDGNFGYGLTTSLSQLFPSVLLAVTGAGDHVAFDTSDFSADVKGFSYPWQILFHSDINSDFMLYYSRDFNSFGRNPNWYAWLNFLAGKGPKSSLRTTQFFSDAFRGIEFDF